MIATEEVAIIIETNGVLLDAALAQFLRATGKVECISVSLDGAKATTHDALRMVSGSFNAAVSGIRFLVEAGLRPQLICTLHRGNAAEIDELLNLAHHLGCGSVKFNHLQKVGRGQRMAVDEGLDVREVIDIYTALEKNVIPHAPFPITFDIPFAFRPISRLLTRSISTCSVLNLLAVLSTGQLSLCGIGVTVPELVFGDLRTDRLRDVWCENPVLQELRRTIPSQLKGICSRCLHRDLCLGECIAHNYHATRRN